MLALRFFLIKEFKQILSHKKAFFISILFIFYTPFLNYNAQHSLLPFNYIIPILFIISGCYPSEYSYTIMNHEFEIHTYDIIYISKVNPFIVILSKLFFPTILGIIICFSSIFTNDLISYFFKPEMYSSFLTFDLACFIFLSIVFSNVFTLFFLNYLKKIISKQTYTISIVINLAIILALFQFFYNGYHKISIFILFLSCIILVIYNCRLLKNYIHLKDDTTKKYFVFKNSYAILIQNSYIHTWNYKNMILVIFITFLLSFYLSLNTTAENIYIYQFIPILINLYINSSIIINSYDIDRKNHIPIFYLICNCNKHFILLSKIIVPFLLSCLSTSVFLVILENNILRNKILIYIFIGLFISLISLLSSMFIHGKFNKQIHFIISIFNLFISSIFLIYCNRFFILILLNIIIYIIIFYWSNKMKYN